MLTSCFVCCQTPKIGVIGDEDLPPSIGMRAGLVETEDIEAAALRGREAVDAGNGDDENQGTVAGKTLIRQIQSHDDKLDRYVSYYEKCCHLRFIIILIFF